MEEWCGAEEGPAKALRLGATWPEVSGGFGGGELNSEASQSREAGSKDAAPGGCGGWGGGGSVGSAPAGSWAASKQSVIAHH
eukprot:1160688-Pelagomonas_calceolata.AAC.4